MRKYEVIEDNGGGLTLVVYVEDKWLVDSGLDEGSVWPEDIDE